MKKAAQIVIHLVLITTIIRETGGTVRRSACVAHFVLALLVFHTNPF
jgi:hypothetical protein